jgi:membrane-associated phospholipid phosphatase
MRDTYPIPRHADGGTSGGDTASWRIACLLALAAFVGMGVAAFLVGILPGDLSLRHELLIERPTALHSLARWANLVGTWRVLLPICLVIFALSRIARRRWWLWAGVFLGSGALEHAFKFLVDRPRPSGFALGFPSGHTTAAAAFAVILIYLASRARLHPATRLSVQVIAVATMLLVGWARIVLRAHWPSDVLGGLLLGTACAAAAAWWDSTRPSRPNEHPGREQAQPPNPQQSRSSEMADIANIADSSSR